MSALFQKKIQIAFLFVIVVFFYAFLSMRFKIIDTENSVSDEYGTKTALVPLIEERMQYCYEQDSGKNCYRQVAIDLLDRSSLDEIMKVFEEDRRDLEIFSKCHELSHYLGEEAYYKTKNIRNVFSQGSNACLGGTFHGALEGYFKDKGTFGFGDDVYAKEVPHLCGTRDQYDREQKFIDCNHGMGHGLMFLTEDDLLRALKLCDTLHTTEEQYLCYSGAFMSNANTSREHQPLYAPKKDNPFYPCTVLEERYLRLCYSYGTLEAVYQDFNQSVNVCAAVPLEYRVDCFRTLGRNMTHLSVSYESTMNQCMSIIESEFQRECILGAAYNFAIGLKQDVAQFCSLAFNEGVQKSCFSEIEQAKSKISRR